MSASASAAVGSPPRAAAADSGARGHQSLLLGVCCLAQFMVILDVSIVNVAIPTIRTSLGFSRTDLQWVINAYAITFAGFLMLSGRAADLFGQRRTFVIGLLVFALASLVGGTAVTQELLIGGRALQGLGGAIMAAASLAIITSSFAPGPERFRAIGLWGAMNGAGGATGTLLGGIITEALSWRWILLINLPIGILGAIVAWSVIAERRPRSSASGFDLGGALAITAGLLALVYGIVSAGSEGWGSLAALGPIALGLVLLASFVLIESRVASPLVPLRVFSARPLRVANGVVLLLSAALFPMWYLTTLYLQEVLRLPPLGAGLAFLPMALTIMACATRAGALVGRFGVRAVLGGGLTLMAAGMGLFAALISVNGSYTSDVLAPGLLVAVGIGFAVVPSTIAATAGAKRHEAGLASGLVNTSRQMGGALGLAILASVGAQYTSHLIDADYQAPLVALTNGFRLSYLLGAAFAATGALVAFRLIPRLPRQAPRPLPDSAPAPRAAPTSQRPNAEASPTGVNPNGNSAIVPPRPATSPQTPDMRGRRVAIPVVFSTASGATWPPSARSSMTSSILGSEHSKRT
jgi:EmrB/QacA subfamily drug resistance transporter